MHPHEESTIRAFFAPARRARWLDGLASAKRRRDTLDRLYHCEDLDGRFVSPLASDLDVLGALRSLGALATCYVISGIAGIDGREMTLEEAVERAESGGWGTLISCIPGLLAYYSDEAGSRRRLLMVRSENLALSPPSVGL